MKTSKAISFWLLLFIVTACTTTNKFITIKQKLQQKIEAKELTIFVTRCIPSDLVNSNFNTDVSLNIKGNNAYANLPFHSDLSVNPNEGTSGPISFDGTMKEYTMFQDSVKGWTLWFKVESGKYPYRVNVQISPKGKAVFEVSSPLRTTMTYWGEVD